MRIDFLSPLFLSKQLGEFTDYDQTFFANSYDFVNPNKAPMLVDQFRFVLNGRATTDVLRYGEFDVDLRVGSIPLTNGFVPVTALCPVYRTPLEHFLVWHLPKPLYVPRGIGISATFRIRRADPNVTFTIENGGRVGPVAFNVVGRSVPMGWPVPKQVFVPWAAATYVNTYINEWVSQDNELVNPHEENLVLQQLLGFTWAGLEDRGRVSNVMVQATTSQNKVLIRDPTPMNLLFPLDRRVLNVSGVLAPKEFIRVALKVKSPSDASVEQRNLAFTTIGMVGYRKIQTPWGAPAK
jgi:hypothetical protein